MTSPATSQELTHELTDLEGAEPSGSVPDDGYRNQINELATRWRGWIDELKVRADLGRMEGRDELHQLVGRVENAWLALKNEVDRAEADADVSIDDLRHDAGVLLNDLRRAARATVSRLQADG